MSATKRFLKRGAVLLGVMVAIIGGWMAYTAAQGPFALKRSAPGVLIRHLVGQPGAVQDVDDVVDELSVSGSGPDGGNAAAVRAWAAEIVRTQQSRAARARTPKQAGLTKWPILVDPDGRVDLTGQADGAERVEIRDLIVDFPPPLRALGAAADTPPPPVFAHNRAIYDDCPPETELVIDKGGRVIGVHLDWGHTRLGLVIVPEGKVPPLEGMFYQREVAGDMRAYSK